MTGRKGQAKGQFNKQAGAVRQLAGRLKGDRALEAKGLAQRAKGSVQDAAGAALRKVTE
ncbi:MAG: CsbD family protein [Actinomycetota bacterium]